MRFEGNTIAAARNRVVMAKTHTPIMPRLFKPYPAYKASGVEWLGEVPAHWEMARLKGIVANVVDLTKESNRDDVYLALEHVESWTGRFAVSANGVGFESQVKRFRAGDVLFGKLRPYLAKVASPSVSGVCVGEFLVLRPRIATLQPRYLDQLLRSKPVIDAIDASTFGAKMPRADWQFIGGMAQPLPPLSEQRGIVRYLDHVGRRIRRYIEAKEKLIGLLEEEKQAIVNQAVTRGLDPNVPLKPSGVEWLGDVPALWETRRSKRLFSPRRELARPNDIQLSATQTYGVIPQDEYERKVGRRVVKISLHLDKRRHVEFDDFVISMRSFQGGLERAWATGCIRSSYIVLRPTNQVDVGFFSHVFKSRAYVKALQSTANFIRDGQDLNFNNFCAVDLPFPPAEEQRLIAVALGEAIAKINSAIVAARRQIELVQEYRTRLIADVVTGKLDVRDAAAQLPAGDFETDPTEQELQTVHGIDEDFYDAGDVGEEPAIEREVRA